MKKYILTVILLAILIVVLAGFLMWPDNKPDNNNQQQNTEGIQITSPKANEEIFSPLRIAGTVNGKGWTGFEGQVGMVRLLDSSGNQLGSTAILTATTNWMQLPVEFETYLTFQSSRTEMGSLAFDNENASGLPENSRQFILPVKITESSGRIMTVKASFNNSNLDPEFSCNKVFPVDRQVPETEAVARAALEELLKGPTELEKDAGFFTSINPGVKIQKLTIENGVARADFDEQLEYQVGGSCRVSAIRAQITETLKQFPTINDIVISINGRTEDILQP